MRPPRPESQLGRAVAQAADLLRGATRAVALTGAGLSTASGISDFRSAGSGLWERYDPAAVASLTAFRYDPEAFLRTLQPLARQLAAAVPNAAHRALAALEAAGRLVGVITQNVDRLHHRAGSRRVVELHGSLGRATCIECYLSADTAPLMKAFVDRGQTPRCDRCGGILKPDIILFGEQLPRQQIESARALCSQADLILVAGSSLEVTPAALLPGEALRAGARLIIVNRQPTYLDGRADALLQAEVEQVLPALAHEVLDG